MNYLTMLFIAFTIVWVIHAEIKPKRRIRIWKGKKGRKKQEAQERVDRFLAAR